MDVMDLSTRSTKAQNPPLSPGGSKTPDSGMMVGSSSSENFDGQNFSTPAKERPRPFLSASKIYAKFSYENHKKSTPSHPVSFTDYVKNVANPTWKRMTVGAKQPYQDLASQEKSRYTKEMQIYKPSPETKSSGKRKRTPKDPKAPKRNLSAFFHFCNQERPKVRNENPNATVGEIAKVLGRRWGECSAADKATFEQMASDDKERYRLDKAAYEQQKSMEMLTVSIPLPAYSHKRGPYDAFEDDSADSESNC